MTGRRGRKSGTDALYAALCDFAFLEPRCCPSQELLAKKLGWSREWVNKKCRELRDRGLISWTKARRPGARWDHNVYALHGPWHRPHRKQVLGWLDKLRKRRFRGPVHTKRTASARKGCLGVASTPSAGGRRPTESSYVGADPDPPPKPARVTAYDGDLGRAATDGVWSLTPTGVGDMPSPSTVKTPRRRANAPGPAPKGLASMQGSPYPDGTDTWLIEAHVCLDEARFALEQYEASHEPQTPILELATGLQAAYWQVAEEIGRGVEPPPLRVL